MKLVDQLADFEGAVKDTARSVNISGEPSLVWPPKERHASLMDLMFGDVSEYLPSKEKLLEQQVGFYYLWK
jgi:protease IV